MPPPAAPAPDYSAAWAAYYQQQAAAAAGAQAGNHPAAPAPYQPAAPAMGAYPYGAQQQPYGAVPGYPGASQPAYPGMQPMGMQPRPPVYPAQPQPYAPSVGPQAYPSARPMQQPKGGYSPYTPGGAGAGSNGPGSNGGAGGGYGPAGGSRPQVGPQAMPMRPPQGAGMGLQQPMGMHSSPNQSFPPAKRPRFDSGPQGPGGGAGPASFTRTGGTIPIPSSAGLPSNPMTIATPMAGPSSSSAGGSEYFAGGDGRDGFSMSSRGGRGGGSSSMRGGKPMRGGYGYEDDYGPPGGGFRGKPRGMMRASPPPSGPTGPRNGNLTTPRGDRGGYKTRGGRGAFAGNQHRDLPDAPRGPASTRNNRQAKEPTTPASQDKQQRPKDVKEDKKTLTDFKIVGLEVPELEWKWGVVPETAREDETEGSGGRKRKAEGGNDEDGPSSPSASTSGPSQKQQRASYFMTHGKETTSKAEQVTRDVNRLRIYFDSPAGQGHGEKRGRGGIEGLRAPPPAPPTGPKAMLAKQESAALAAKEESQPAVEPAEEPPVEAKQEPVDTVVPEAKSVKEESSTAEDVPPIKTEEMPDVVPAKDEAPAPAADSVAISSASTAEDDVEGLLATLSQEVIDGTSAAALDTQADDAPGDVSMLSARGSSEPETDPAQPEEPSTTTTEPPADADATTAARSTEPETASRPASPVKEDRELSMAPTVSEAGPAESVRATPAPETGDVDIYYRGPEPSDDRISILYERSTRRLCIDADVVERVRISRTEGKVELTIRWNKGAHGAAAEVVANGSKPAELVDAPVVAEATPAVEGAQADEAAAAPAAESESAAVDPSLAAGPVSDAAPTDGTADVAVKDEAEADPAVRESSGTVVASGATAAPPVVSAAASSETADPRTWDICRGVLMEQLDEETETFKPVNFETLDDMWDGVVDPCAGWTPPIHKLITADSDPATPYPTLKCDTFKIVAYLDQDRPLSEPKWVRTGQVEDWLNELFGRMKVGNKKASNWRGKFEILDPEPAPQTPTIQNALDSWATNSTSGSAKERRRFVKTHLCEMDNIFEILLRLSRGLSGGSGPVTPANLAGPLATAASPNSHYAGKQTHVSLAVLAMLRLTYELAEKAGVPATEVNERVSDIIRSIPSSVLFKSVDSLFRDHLAEKKH